jgi:N-acetylmuramoyl-L-alanine amidase
MGGFKLKYISFITLFFLILYIIAPIFIINPLFTPRVYAASIEHDDLYRGIAIALLLILISKIAKSSQRPDIDDYTQTDINYLARVIYAEARGESYTGQVAVGAVVLNRINSNEFPNTVRDVIYQKGQFSSVENGQINMIPDLTAYKAARDAMNGVDPTFGAIYFYNPDTAKTLWWLTTREPTVRIGNHVFAK